MPHEITRCFLPPGRGDFSALTPAEAGTRFSDPGGMQGWVDLVPEVAFSIHWLLMLGVAVTCSALTLLVGWVAGRASHCYVRVSVVHRREVVFRTDRGKTEGIALHEVQLENDRCCRFRERHSVTSVLTIFIPPPHSRQTDFGLQLTNTTNTKLRPKATKCQIILAVHFCHCAYVGSIVFVLPHLLWFYLYQTSWH